jgi:hypothetical protein
MCARCDPYGDSLATTSLAQLELVVAMIRKAREQADLEWLDGDERARVGDAHALLQAARSHADRPLHGRWLCSECSRLFLLELNATTVSGDGWRPLYGN